METVASAALAHMQRLIPFRRASVTLFDLEANDVSLLAAYPGGSIELGEAWQVPFKADPFMDRMRRGRIHTEEELGALDSPPELLQELRKLGVHAYLRVPLIARETLIGSLNIGLATAGQPSEETLDIAREVADELATGIQQARLAKEVQRHAERLEQTVKRRTAALRVSRARFRSVFEEAAIGIALVDGRGHILDSNPALERMLGYTDDELEGMVFADLAHPDNVRDDADLYRELLAGARTHYNLEGRYVCKDGRSIYANLAVSMVRPGAKESHFAIALVEDITERKRAEAALVESEKLALTGRLAASVAHEINNPLQSVIGCLSLAQEDLAAGEDPSRFVEIAVEELERAADLVSRMRDLSRPSEHLARKPTDVNALVERVLLLTQKRCQDRHVEVDWEGAPSLPMLSLVAGRMQQVFLNIVLNAVDAMPDGGQLHVRTAWMEEPHGIEITFADQGVGISAEDMAHLFEPFHTTKALGLGLGLYVSRGIVTDHGGRIEIESREGEGASCTVWLPA
jgi:PAS domain S-box-containing protein